MKDHMLLSKLQSTNVFYSAVRLVISLATAPPAVTTAASTTAAVVWVARLAIPAVVLVT